METDFNRRADALIREGLFAEARELLERAIREMPVGWTPSRDLGRALAVAFWNEDEFFAHGKSQANAQSTLWVPDSYSKAWYQLAVVAVEQEQFEQAMFSIDCGLELEPDHPELWCEKGFILGRLERHQEAFECFVRAASARSWAPPAYLARALRGQGVELIDLDRLEEAEEALTRSLELEPDSNVARNELEYIGQLRQSDASSGALPWFAQAFLNPPKDPLTIRLLQLVEDMPPIAGPQTVGRENYSRIAQAFTERGWEGFEQEFDRIVPRNRPDYADVKRDLLCEPLFNRKVHRRLTGLFTGETGLDEVFEEIQRDATRKPQ